MTTVRRRRSTWCAAPLAAQQGLDANDAFPQVTDIVAQFADLLAQSTDLLTQSADPLIQSADLLAQFAELCVQAPHLNANLLEISVELLMKKTKTADDRRDSKRPQPFEQPEFVLAYHLEWQGPGCLT